MINIVLELYPTGDCPLEEASERCFLFRISIKVFLLSLLQYFGYVLFTLCSYIFVNIALTFLFEISKHITSGIKAFSYARTHPIFRDFF